MASQPFRTKSEVDSTKPRINDKKCPRIERIAYFLDKGVVKGNFLGQKMRYFVRMTIIAIAI